MGGMKTKLLIVALLGIVAFGGYAVGQDAGEATGAAKSFLFDMLATQTSGDAASYERAAAAIAKSPNEPATVQQAIRMGLVGGKDNPDTLLLAVQVAQNQKLIEQNAHILELLEKQAK
jgi:hypothetical protein